MSSAVEIPAPLSLRFLVSCILGITAAVALSIWWALDGPRTAIAALCAVTAFVALTQDLRLLADPRGGARVAWTVAGVPFLVLRRAPLGAVREVLVQRREVPRDSVTDTIVLYDVSLATTPPLRLWSVGTPARARALAVRVARALGLALRDTSDGWPRLRSREELALNLGQLLRRRGVEPAPLVVPTGSPIRLLPGSTSELRLPARPWRTRPLFLGLWFLSVAGTLTGVQAGFTNAGVGIFLFCAVLFCFTSRTLVRMHRNAFIRIDGDRVVTGLAGLRRRRIPFEDLQDVYPIGLREMVLISARRRVVVPYLFLPDELALAVAFVERAALAHRSSRHPFSNLSPT